MASQDVCAEEPSTARWTRASKPREPQMTALAFLAGLWRCAKYEYTVLVVAGGATVLRRDLQTGALRRFPRIIAQKGTWVVWGETYLLRAVTADVLIWQKTAHRHLAWHWTRVPPLRPPPGLENELSLNSFS